MGFGAAQKHTKFFGDSDQRGELKSASIVFEGRGQCPIGSGGLDDWKTEDETSDYFRDDVVFHSRACRICIQLDAAASVIILVCTRWPA